MKLIIALLVCFLGFMLFTDSREERMRKYAEEHNCIYASNGLCYTYAERPWLFK